MHPLTYTRHVLNINTFLTDTNTNSLPLAHSLVVFKAHTGHLLLKLCFGPFGSYSHAFVTSNLHGLKQNTTVFIVLSLYHG